LKINNLYYYKWILVLDRDYSLRSKLGGILQIYDGGVGAADEPALPPAISALFAAVSGYHPLPPATLSFLSSPPQRHSHPPAIGLPRQHLRVACLSALVHLP
jgi:hypothetical protein